MSNPLLLFTFVISHSLKDEVVDTLMSSKLATGFNITSIMGYSQEHSQYNTEEQVRGYQNINQFEILVDEKNLLALKKYLSPLFQTMKVRYWITPIVETGHIFFNEEKYDE